MHKCLHVWCYTGTPQTDILPLISRSLLAVTGSVGAASLIPTLSSGCATASSLIKGSCSYANGGSTPIWCGWVHLMAGLGARRQVLQAMLQLLPPVQGWGDQPEMGKGRKSWFVTGISKGALSEFDAQMPSILNRAWMPNPQGCPNNFNFSRQI